MNENFKKIIDDFSLCMKNIDSTRPVYQSVRKSATVYKPGIGPHTETKTVQMVVEEMKKIDNEFYKDTIIHERYPNSRKECDLKFKLKNEVIFSEVKMMRIMGDNNKANDNIFMHIFSPYELQNSALTDGIKLLKSGFEGTKSIIIYGYDYENFPLLKTIELYEKIAKEFYSISERYSSSFENLVHPVHQKGNVFGWIIEKI